MALVSQIEFVLDGGWDIKEFEEFDSVNFPNVYIINKKQCSQTTSSCYLYDMIKKKDIYKFPGDFYNFYTNITTKINFKDRSLSEFWTYWSGKDINFIYYNQINQTFTFYSYNRYDSSPILNMEIVKISYKGYDFKIDTLNKLELSTSSAPVYLKEQNYLIINCVRQETVTFVNFNTLEIISEYKDKKILFFSKCGPNNYDQTKSTRRQYYGGITFLHGQDELIIYDYINNKELDTIVNINSAIIHHKGGNYYTIQNGSKTGNTFIGKTTSLYNFIKEDDIPDENKCVICFSNTSRKKVLVPCGHTQFCEECLDNIELRNCPLCREYIEKIIKLF